MYHSTLSEWRLCNSSISVRTVLLMNLSLRCSAANDSRLRAAGARAVVLADRARLDARPFVTLRDKVTSFAASRLGRRWDDVRGRARIAWPRRAVENQAVTRSSIADGYRARRRRTPRVRTRHVIGPPK